MSVGRHMFGYITICKPELKIKDFEKYRGYYCGLCQELKERYGLGGQMTLTYDMTFLILLLTSLYEMETEEERHHCRVHPVKRQRMLRGPVTTYAADMNLLLAWYHLKDDWADERKVSSLTDLRACQWEIFSTPAPADGHTAAARLNGGGGALVRSLHITAGDGRGEEGAQ